LIMAGFATSAGAIELDDLWRRPDQRAMQLLDADKPSEAAEAFEDKRWQGVSHYRAGDYAKAAEAFGQSEGALYNQATSAVRAGDYQTAIEQFEQLLEQNPDHQDAQHNLDIARQLAGQDSEQAGQSGEEDKPSEEQRESEQDGDNQNQSAEQQNDAASESESSQDQQPGEQQNEQNNQQSGDQSDAAEPPSELSEREQPEQQQSREEEGQSGDAQANDEEDPQQEIAAIEDQLSEVDQATEQWLRRIPDDPSQLLRGKIRLKHRTDYRDVGDMVEPW
jgi:Ca-activated chloride channel family protein